MGPDQLTAVMETVGKSVDPELKGRIERESDAAFSSARLWDDGVIPPARTRQMLALGLETALEGKKDEPATRFGIFRM